MVAEEDRAGFMVARMRMGHEARSAGVVHFGRGNIGNIRNIHHAYRCWCGGRGRGPGAERDGCRELFAEASVEGDAMACVGCQGEL